MVGNESIIEDAVDQFGILEVLRPPEPSHITIVELEILRADLDCFAAWAVVDATDLVTGTNDGVHVFLRGDSQWLFVSQWANRGDLWEDDCDSSL